MNRTFLLVGVCTIVGIGTLAYGMTILLDAFASSSWPTTTGRMTKAEIVRSTSGTGTSRKTSYHLEVRYTYTVDATDYVGDRISFSDEVSKSHSRAQRIADRYPVGREVRVHYDPEDPDTSALETGASLASFALPGFGAVLIVAGVVFAVRERLGRGTGSPNA